MSDNLVSNFEEYLRQGEPEKSDRAKAWKTAIGLQQVDGLRPSDYLIETARKNIEGYLSIDEVKQQIDSYYIQNPVVNKENRTEEADKVSTRIVEILNEQTFVLSPAEYLSIHRRLFQGIDLYAGKIRDYNITKKEWILNGETVLYGSAHSLKATLEYDFEQEKKFSYKGLNKYEIIDHMADFISNLWQIHIFGEGNTRTTALFLIKYLRKLGFKDANNDLFEKHSWYFRNALVRANYEDLSRGVQANKNYLIRFLSNLLLNKNYLLKNREMHINYAEFLKLQHDIVSDTVNTGNDTANAGDDTVNTGDDTVNTGDDTVNTGSDTVNTGSDTVNTGNDTVNTGNDTANAGDDTVNTGSDTVNTGSDTVNTGNDTVNTGNDTVNTGNDTVNTGNDTLNTENDTVNAGDDTVINLMKENRDITAVEISEKLHISLSTVKRRIKALKESGKIIRKGSDKAGHWEVRNE